MATAAAWLRAAGIRFSPPWTPSAAACLLGLAGALLVAFRIAQKPATDAAAVVKIGAPLGLVCVGVLALGARFAWRAEGEAVGDGAAEGEDRERRRPVPAPTAVAAAAAPSQPGLWAAGDTESDWAPDWDDQHRVAEQPAPREESRRDRRRNRRSRRRR
jgi:hypothetical protein